MIERISIATLAILSLLSIWLAPWAALARQTGAKSAVLLLPNRFFDFTGRTDALEVTSLMPVMLLSLLLLAVIFLASFLNFKLRSLVWLGASILLVLVTAWGLNRVQETVRSAQFNQISTLITEELVDPRDRTDVEALTEVLDNANTRAVGLTVLEARQAGFTIRRLSYAGSGIGLAAFLAYATSILAFFFGLRYFERLDKALNQTLRLIAVPAVSILLSLILAGVVILILQPTGFGGDFVIDTPFKQIVGRLETIWRAYLTLFADSLGTLSGFSESLKFATPLIFTGLAVAFGFQAGLFNIGAPGQMVLGAVICHACGCLHART